MGSTNVVTGEEELRLRRQWENEILRKVLADRALFDRVRGVFQEISEGVAPGTQPGTKKHDLADEYRQQFEDWYRSLKLAVTVPRPNFSNRAITKHRARGQDLVFRPATKDVSYEAFMAANGQGNHWTVTDAAERSKIGWEPCEQGYWFWADVQDECPRLGTSWNDLSTQIQLLFLEEYVIVWHATKAMSSRLLDVRTWCWLRTRFGPGALYADEYEGRVNVRRDSAEGLFVSSGNGGGRALDVVK